MDDNCDFRTCLYECLKLGLVQSQSGKFLTAEVFNNEINISGTALRRKQLWTIVILNGKQADNVTSVYLQNHLGRFLSVNKDGKVSTVSHKPDTEECFNLEFSPDNTGEWAIKSTTYGFYLSGSDNKVSCFSKTPVWWIIRLAIHPQIHIRHQFRSRYLRCIVGDRAEIRADQAYPWGVESIFYLEQLPMQSTNSNLPKSCLGRIALRSFNEKYLKFDGTLTDQLNEDVLYGIEFKPGKPSTFAFRHVHGANLNALGPGTIKSKQQQSTSASKEEWFLIEQASLQVGILASNGKFASNKQGTEVCANQNELNDTAIFELTYIGGVDKGYNVLDTIAFQPLQKQSICGPDGDLLALNGHILNNIDLMNSLSMLSASVANTTTTTTTNNNISNNSISSKTAATVTTNGESTKSAYFLLTGHWKLRCRSGSLWKFSPSSVVKTSGSDDDKDCLFDQMLLHKPSESGYPQFVFRVSNDASTQSSTDTSSEGQLVSARKLGTISTGTVKLVKDSQEPIVSSTDELFRIVLVARKAIIIRSSLTGGFVARNKLNQLDCSGLSYEAFQIRITKNYNYVFFSCNSNGNSYSLWSVNKSDGSLQLEQTDKLPDDMDYHSISERDFDRRFEFQLHFLGHGRALIQSMAADLSNASSLLLRSELKGDCRCELNAAELSINHIWEI